MRILFTIAHYFNPEGSGRHGSLRRDPASRITALSNCIASLHQLFGRGQGMLQIADRSLIPANRSQVHEITVAICTVGDRHLLAELPLSAHLYTQVPTSAEPMLLGYECQAVLRSALGQYDYYCFLEDDLVIHDPWFFAKLVWFTSRAGNQALLQPNRYEVASQAVVPKVYVDGDLAPEVAGRFQNIQERSELTGEVLGQRVRFVRPLNPHSGCYFLNQEQLEHWARQPHFLDRDIRFVGPLESAATLGIMRSFTLYKPAPENAGFLEIQHSGTQFLALVGQSILIGRGS